MLHLPRLYALAALTALATACATAPNPKPSSPAHGAPAPAQKPGPEAAAADAAAPTRAAGGAPPPAAASQTARPGEPPPLRAFADVIKDAKESKGFFTVWQKDERTWLEIRNDQLEAPFFFGHSLASGLGERFFLPGLMGREQVVQFRRVGNSVQLIANNLAVRAPQGTPLATAVRESYSDSLLAAAPVVSALHPERKSFLVDAGALFGADLPGAQTALETAYRLSYGFDRGNSHIERVRATDAGTFITYRAHFAVPKLPAPPATPPAPGTPQPSPPGSVPDPRSLFLSFAYTLAPLPAEPMKPRLADQRIGHFTDPFWDLGNRAGGDARTHYITRWRLEKKDPAAEVSEPKEPIVVWMDRNIPEKYREPVRQAILEWNKAFERAGFRNALEVRQQPDDADWSTVEGTRHIAMRWFAMQPQGAVAVGPSQSDPRTGEILRGASIVPENWVRLARARLADTQPRLPPASLGDLLDAGSCTYADEALAHAAFAFELLVARGGFDPDGPQAERFIADSLKAVVIHEIGHALGLRHNFKASTGIKLEQLRQAAFTRERGVSNSVMDYNPPNVPLEDEPVGDYFQTVLGEYDYWAIEYAYRELPPEREAEELRRIAARAIGNPALAYATDEDAATMFGGGIDPLANQFDLGDDPLAFYRRSFALARELWARTQTRSLREGESYALYRRNLGRGLAQFSFAVPLIAKYVGGVITSRSVPGSGDGAPLLEPVPAARQREALDLLAREVFSVDSFRFDPQFMQRIGIDHLDRFVDPRAPVTNPDYSLATNVLNMQRAALDQLMSDGVAARLADAEVKVADPAQRLTLAEVHERIAEAVWSELRTGREIDSLRRNLQREHARRVAAGLVRATPPVAADVRAVNRAVALRLQADLQRAARNPRLSATTRAHLAEMQSVIDEALRAPLVRQAI